MVSKDRRCYGAASKIVSVQYCQNSTITEAWAVIWGLPAALDVTDVAVLLRAAKERIPGIQQEPTVVTVQVTDELANPFWREQVAWDGDRYMARFGHRYLSIHFRRRGERRYETFEKSLRPAVDTWLGLYADALTRGDDKHAVDRMAFGYVNRFDFEPEGFDLSRFFKMSFSVGVAAKTEGLITIDTGCSFLDQERDARLTIQLAAESPSDANPKIRVITRVVAERRGLEDVSYAEPEQLSAILLVAKDAAKDTFFSFATEETHAIMGVVNAAD